MLGREEPADKGGRRHRQQHHRRGQNDADRDPGEAEGGRKSDAEPEALALLVGEGSVALHRQAASGPGREALDHRSSPRRASIEMLVTPYFWVALSARSEMKR